MCAVYGFIRKSFTPMQSWVNVANIVMSRSKHYFSLEYTYHRLRAYERCVDSTKRVLTGRYVNATNYNKKKKESLALKKSDQKFESIK